MPDLTSRLTVKLIDSVSAPARGAARALKGLNAAAHSGGRGGGLVAVQERLAAAAERNRKAVVAMQGRMLGAAAGAYAVGRSVSGVVKPAVAFESAMADVAKVTSLSDDGIAAFGRQLRHLAVTEIPMSVDQLAALAAAAAQAGVPDDDLLEFTRLTAKAAVAWEVTGQQAGEALAKLRSALGLSNDEVGKFADAVNHLSDSTASSAPDLIDFARRVAAQGEFFGFGKEQTLAFGAAMVGAGAQADVAATSFRNMGRALTRGASATKMQRRGFAALGLDAKRVAKAMSRDAVGVSLDVMSRIGKLPEHLRASTMTDIFGDEARALAPLLGRLDILRDALKLVAQEQDYVGSVGREFERRARTTEYALERFRSQVRDVALALGGGLLPALRGMLSAIGPAMLRLSAFAEKHADLIVKVGAATAGLVGLKVAALGLRFIGLLGKGWLIGFALGAVKMAGGMASAAGGAVALQRALARMSGQRMTALQTLATGLAGIVRAIPGVGVVAGALGALAGALTGPVIGAVAAFAAGGLLMWKYWDRISAVVGGAAARLGEELAPALDMVRPVLDALAPVARAVGDAFAWIGEKASAVGSFFGGLFKKENLSDADKAALEASGRAMMDALLTGLKSGAAAIFGYVSGLASRIASSIASAASGAGRALRGAASAIVSGGTPAPARARGGRVSRGQPYTVGERRPELFVPDASGRIVPRIPDGRGAGAPVTVNASITVNGAGDAEGVARKVVSVLRREMQDGLRAAMGDTGPGFAY